MGPITQGNRRVTMPAPNLSSGSPKIAFSDAIAMSQDKANSKAPAIHAPWMAATVGFGLFQNRIVVLKSKSRISRQIFSPAGLASIWALRSKPDENARPAPHKIITRTLLSASAKSIASLISINVALSKAFSLSGRFKVISAICSLVSYKIELNFFIL